jgi:hypothetical protein
MHIKRILIPIISFLILFQTFTYGAETVTLKASNEIADAIKINKAIDLVTDKVMECVNNNLAPAKKCYCLYPNEVTSFKSTVNTILKKHPEWEGKTISWQIQNDPRGYGYNISIPGIQTQMKMMCE